MTIRRTSVAALAAATTIALGAGGASAATLNPRATAPLVQLACPSGQVLDVYTIANSGHFDHAPMGFVTGGALAARWTTGTESGAISIADGVHAGQVITYSFANSGPIGSSHRTTEPDLSRLVGCDNVGAATEQWTGTLDEEALGFLGLSADYLGAAYSAEASRTFTVYFAPEQLAHR